MYITSVVIEFLQDSYDLNHRPFQLLIQLVVEPFLLAHFLHDVIELGLKLSIVSRNSLDCLF